MEIPFSGTLTKDDLSRSSAALNSLHGMKSRSPLFMIRIIGFLFLLTGGCLIAADHYTIGRVIPLFGPVGLVAVIAGVTCFLAKFKVAEPQGLPVDIRGVASESGIQHEETYVSTEFRWEAFNRKIITDEYVCLSRFPISQVSLLPRRFFASDEDWSRFVKLVERRIPSVH